MILMMIVLTVVIERKNVLRGGRLQRACQVVTYITFVHVLVAPLPPGVLGYY